ncbi:non-structural maintenance of chromosomes element 1 homolog [Folsomia candida]|uniref:Non-structural maintenance of chromosomes element 1 homolog n=1 Tax=Folsomia candida TaxID=158441 RepID=A0A226E201_FOLCA|nr:non-structural maintenance of chromosomes element 1 homolog [Folsomia candida]XP_035710149.1 non-structural maintenance of chromosomes element 1 homolog [Folsomia candida]OXA51310.1 Non-structural maintenance of chromosomes element 1 [Folsomia candida]
MDDEGFSYGDMHKIVLQGIMSAGFLDARGVKNLFKGACNALNLDEEQRTSMQAVQKVVREINEKIKPYDMAIRSASCELTGKKFYVFLITVEKPIMKMQTLFSKGELELFQKIMTAVLRKYDHFAVPVMDCNNMAREIDARNFSIEMAEAFVQKMIALQYFAKYYLDPKGPEYEITIGIRTIREFEPILREVYDDVMTNCHLCKMIMLHGHQCPKCSLFVHKACLEKYIKTCKTCPGCKTGWTEKNMVKRVRQAQGDETPDTPRPEKENTPSTSRGSGRRQQASPQSKQKSQPEMPVLQPMVAGKRGSRSKVKSPSPQASSTSKGGNKGATKNTSPTPSKGSAATKGRGGRRKKKAAALPSSSEEDSD